jgi:serine/threonine protein kinase
MPQSTTAASSGMDDIDMQALGLSYEVLSKLGEGSYGIVFKAKLKATGAFVAIKKIRLDTTGGEGIPATTIREVTLLQELDHQHIVKLLEVVCVTHRVYLVFELLAEDLRHLISRLHKEKRVLSIETAREYTRQMLLALWYCHQNRVIHRDLKPGNVLVASPQCIKIADFGLARPLEQHVMTYTNEVVTLWYRPPELLLGEPHYSPAVDVWAVGCILAEMVNGKALLPGASDMDQLTRTFKIFGTPTEKTWPGVSALRHYSSNLPMHQPADLTQIVPGQDPKFYSFLKALLSVNPKERISVHDALQHPWISETSDL